MIRLDPATFQPSGGAGTAALRGAWRIFEIWLPGTARRGPGRSDKSSEGGERRETEALRFFEKVVR